MHLRPKRFPLVRAIVGTLLLASCGESTTAEPGEDLRSQAPAPLPNHWDVSIAASGAAEFMVVNGAVGTGDYRPSSEFVRVTPDGSTVVAELDIPLRFPVSWANEDGSITVLGLDCDRDGKESAYLACAGPEIVWVDIQPDNSLEVRRLGVSGSGYGLDAAPAPFGGVLVLIYTRDSHFPSVYHFTRDSDEPVVLGEVEARRICRAGNRAFVYPFDVSRAAFSRALYEVKPDGVERLADIEPLDSDMSSVSDCLPDGSVIVGGVTLDGVSKHTINFSDPTTLTPLEVPSEYAGGNLQGGHRDDLVSWTIMEFRGEMDGMDSWRLNRRHNGAWESLGAVESDLIPQNTTASRDAVAAVVLGPKGRKIEVLP